MVRNKHEFIFLFLLFVSRGVLKYSSIYNYNQVEDLSMNFLTSAILSGVAWDIIKSWGYIKSEHLKHKLQDWIIDEKYYETIAEIINEFPDEYKKSVKFLEAAIDEDSDLQNILKLAKISTVSIQNTSGSEFNNSTIVNNNSGVINNNFTQKKKLK